ncbi:MAG: TIGR04282 family arsenosugar biosynthesis glycosyltransferase [Saprospiraceae bacterium]|nr:TIGR04282 family arsenosugar biosynthesis glycosyltransferase [Saprospiraceae bacterium]
MKNALIIFIKNPALGKVKTRLARTVGDEKALDIYLELTDITRQNALQLVDVSCHVFYSDFINLTDEWANTFFTKHVQTGNDLGERMSNAFDSILKIHKNALIIGSDCPTLTTEIMEQALVKLENHDFVVGPSTDGGYYLLGFGQKNLNSFVFENMDWSTDKVLSTTLKRIKQHKKTMYLLPPLTDIDEEKDWADYRK